MSLIKGMHLNVFIILTICIHCFSVSPQLFTPQHACGDQRSTCRSQFSPSTMCVDPSLGLKRRSPGLAASIFTHQDILLV